MKTCMCLEPTHIYDANPIELIQKFMVYLERHRRNIQAIVREEFTPEDASLIPVKQ